jgi:hypothetical protein
LMEQSSEPDNLMLRLGLAEKLLRQGGCWLGEMV